MPDETSEFKFSCPHCGQHLEAEADMVGMELECPACGQRLIIPPFQTMFQDEDAVSENSVTYDMEESSGNSKGSREIAEASRGEAPVETADQPNGENSNEVESEEPVEIGTAQKRKKAIRRLKKLCIVASVVAVVVGLSVVVCMLLSENVDTLHNPHQGLFGTIVATLSENEETAEELFKRGLKYYNGDDAKDIAEAVKWYRKAAEQGYVDAQAALGLCYYNGEGVERDMTEAMKWFLKAAEQGHAESQCLLGLGYESGTGVPMDKREAIRWLLKAGAQGQIKAQVELAACYLLGRGVEQDYNQSMMWCRKAAEQGDPEAQYMLAGFYRNGLGVEKDWDEAAKWFHKAAAQGYSRAQKALDELPEFKQKEGRTRKVKQISRSIVCCNLSNNALGARSKSISFLESKPNYSCLKVRFTSDPKKADATFYFGFFGWGEEALKISYTHDPGQADVVYNVVDSNPYWSSAGTTVYIVKDASSPVDMTLCITYDPKVEAIKMQEPCITSDSNQQRVAIMYMLGFFK